MDAHSGKKNEHIYQEDADIDEVGQRIDKCLNEIFHTWNDIYCF